jgi:hypothetical protein
MDNTKANRDKLDTIINVLDEALQNLQELDFDQQEPCIGNARAYISDASVALIRLWQSLENVDVPETVPGYHSSKK